MHYVSLCKSFQPSLHQLLIEIIYKVIHLTISTLYRSKKSCSRMMIGNLLTSLEHIRWWVQPTKLELAIHCTILFLGTLQQCFQRFSAAYFCKKQIFMSSSLVDVCWNLIKLTTLTTRIDVSSEEQWLWLENFV